MGWCWWLAILAAVCLKCTVRSGILRTGTPLPWRVAKPVLNSVRRSGITQFINHYNRAKDVETPLFLWGDELEYGLFRYDNATRRFDVSMRGKEVKELLAEKEKGLTALGTGCEWQPEFGSWMVEAVPRDPFGGYISDLFLVEKNMQLRRRRLHAALLKDEIAPSAANFPMLGCEGYAHAVDRRGEVANSAYVSDALINPHPRFGTLVRNIRARRGGNVDIRVPPADRRTVGALHGDAFDSRESAVVRDVASGGAAGGDDIHMDAMAFGMGCCCLQITMQAKSDRESRFLHDQLTTLAPMMLALSASTPIFKGQLAGTDTRWDVISQAVDDRTACERGVPCAGPGVCSDPELVGGGVRRLSKSRYSSVSRYMGKAETAAEYAALEALNDVEAAVDEEALAMLVEGGVDASLAHHVAHLFTRDPLVIFDDAVHLDDTKVTDHFENIQSTTWRTLRWKTPSVAVGIEAEARARRRSDKKVFSLFSFASNKKDALDGSPNGNGDAAGEDKDKDQRDLQSFGPGWRVEFRPMEIQLTDFENAAFALLTVLASRCLLAMGYNFYLPMSMVEENMRRAQLQNAAVEQKFWVRKEAFRSSLVAAGNAGGASTLGDVDSGRPLVPTAAEITPVELTLNEFFNGKQASAVDRVAGVPGDGFPGLIPAIYGYLEALGCDPLTTGRLRPYLTLLSKRASGELPTTAQWIRNVVRSHPEYAGDGRVTPGIADALLVLCDDVGMGRVQRPDLVGDARIEKLCVADVTERYLLSSLAGSNSSSSGSSVAVAVDDGASCAEAEAVEQPCVPYNPLNQCSTVRCDNNSSPVPGPPQPHPWFLLDPDTYLDTVLM